LITENRRVPLAVRLASVSFRSCDHAPARKRSPVVGSASFARSRDAAQLLHTLDVKLALHPEIPTLSICAGAPSFQQLTNGTEAAT